LQQARGARRRQRPAEITQKTEDKADERTTPEQGGNRRVIGPAAYAAYARAADGGNGIAWYATLGAGTAALTLATAAATLRAGPSPRARTAAAAAGILSLAHSLTTTKAAPIMLGLRRDDRGSQQLAEALDRFQRWQTIRAILQAATLGASLMLSLETHRRRG
jgi:hypothetical protein